MLKNGGPGVVLPPTIPDGMTVKILLSSGLLPRILVKPIEDRGNSSAISRANAPAASC